MKKLKIALPVLVSLLMAFVFLQGAGLNDDPNSTPQYLGVQYTPKTFSQIPAPGAAIGTEYVITDGQTCNVGTAVTAGGGVCKCVVMSDGVQWVAEFILGLAAATPSATPTPGPQQRASAGSCASGTSCAMTLPAGMINNDLLVCEFNRPSAVGALTYPVGVSSNYQSILGGALPTYNSAASSVDHLWHRWVTGDSTTTVTLSWTGASTASYSCLAAQNVPTTTLTFPTMDYPFQVQGSTSNVSAATATTPLVTTTTANSLIVYWMAAPAANTITVNISAANPASVTGTTLVAGATASSANGSDALAFGQDSISGVSQPNTGLTFNLSPNATSIGTMLSIVQSAPATSIPYASQIPTMSNQQIFSPGPHIYNGHSYTVMGDGVTDDTAALQDAVIQGDVLIQPSTVTPPVGVCGNVPCYLIKGDVADAFNVPAVWLPANRQVRCTPDASPAQTYNVNTSTGVLTSVTPNPNAATLYSPYSGTTLPSPNSGNGFSAIFRNQTPPSGALGGQHIFGCNFRGTNTTLPATYTQAPAGNGWNIYGYEFLVLLQDAPNFVVAGNDFQMAQGQAGVEVISHSAASPINNVYMGYNTSQHNGLYSINWDNTQFSLFEHNISLDGRIGSELDFANQTPNHNAANYNIVLADSNVRVGDLGVARSTANLTEDCSLAGTINFTTDTWDHNIVEGFSGCSDTTTGGTCSTRCVNGGANPPVVTNPTCTNGCVPH